MSLSPAPDGSCFLHGDFYGECSECAERRKFSRHGSTREKRCGFAAHGHLGCVLNRGHVGSCVWEKP